jgi:hypothetical protein
VIKLTIGDRVIETPTTDELAAAMVRERIATDRAKPLPPLSPGLDFFIAEHAGAVVAVNMKRGLVKAYDGNRLASQGRLEDASAFLPAAQLVALDKAIELATSRRRRTSAELAAIMRGPP